MPVTGNRLPFRCLERDNIATLKDRTAHVPIRLPAMFTDNIMNKKNSGNPTWSAGESNPYGIFLKNVKRMFKKATTIPTLFYPILTDGID